MPDPKYLTLVRRLAERTIGGNVEWEETAEEDVFQTSFTDHSIQIWRTRNPEYDEYDYHIGVYKPSGTRVVTISDTDFTGPESTTAFQSLSATYEQARRSALGADEAIDAILSALSSRPSRPRQP